MERKATTHVGSWLSLSCVPSPAKQVGTSRFRAEAMGNENSAPPAAGAWPDLQHKKRNATAELGRDRPGTETLGPLLKRKIKTAADQAASMLMPPPSSKCLYKHKATRQLGGDLLMNMAETAAPLLKWMQNEANEAAVRTMVPAPSSENLYKHEAMGQLGGDLLMNLDETSVPLLKWIKNDPDEAAVKTMVPPPSSENLLKHKATGQLGGTLFSKQTETAKPSLVKRIATAADEASAEAATKLLSAPPSGCLYKLKSKDQPGRNHPRTVAIPYTCGSSRLFSGAVAGEHSFIWKFTWIDIVRCKFSIMGKPRDTKIAILPSTTRKGTTLSTSAALDSPSVISKLVSPPQASNAGTSAESENSSHNCDDASAVLDNDGSLGSFLDATIAKSRQIENTETPNENAATPVNSPESVEYSSDDLDEDYVELDDDFIEKCNATTDARKIKKLLAEHAVRYKLSPDPKFATSPINIRDKDYDFSLDLSHIAIVEKTPFCGTEKESAVEHMTELSTLSGLFSDDIKMRTYFVAKIFPFSLKDDAKTWYNNLPPGSIKSPKELLDVFFRKYFPASAQHAALQRIYNFDQEDGEKLPEAWARFCSLIRAQPDHDLEKHDLLDIFYSGLTIESRAYLDSCAGCVFRKRTPDDAEELLAKIGRNHDDWSTPEPTPTPIVKKRGMIKLNDEDMREAKKSLKEKGIKPEDVKNLPPIEDLCEITPPSSMIEYMKDIVTNKRKIPNEEISTMLANYSFNGKIPKKLGDPDKLIPTDISLQMADKSTAIPVGLCENVPVQVTQHCLILTDFVVLEMPEDDNMSIILGRPFLNTAGAVIDCNKGMVTFNVDDKEHTVYFPKRIDKDFEFHRSQTNPMVRYKIYNKTIDLPFDVYGCFYSCRQCWASKSRGL
ncbi:hypothetical protein QYE76_016109 [Lolium multiflorum]|uniref:Retrotransposon gag domain-containing protein n=1 Tax=Lolium multiflorum TaxID=4521 RepID=A0AAD8U637_LOLMU|nr:hypothetical protein QYE76_016109 [Lolium multiflorum]